MQETQLSLKNRATRLEISQGHQTIRYVTYGFLLVCHINFVPKTRRFWNPGYGSLKVIGTDTDRSASYDFLLTFHGLSRTVSEIG